MQQSAGVAEEKQPPTSGIPDVTPWKHGGEESARFAGLSKLFTRPSEKFVPPPFDPEEGDYLSWIQEDRRILVVGAGGLGCEILKDLALSGFRDIEVIDLDVIELSNLNRQFLFRMKDIDQPKAKCAAEFVMKRVPACKIKWHNKPIQEFGEGFYKSFDCVIAGLDNIEARRWLNAMLYDLVQKDDDGNLVPDTIIPFIDGGTEAFGGQVRLFVPHLSSCFECSVGAAPPPRVFQSCTIASIPRRPEHCIAYAHKVLWHKLRSLKTATEYDMVPEDDKNTPDPDGVKLDTDSVDHMSWLYHRALERSEKFKIEGVTYNLTMQVVKNIIPAIASTNALVSAACVNECLKSLTWCSYGLNNYFMYSGQEGTYSRTFPFGKNPTCIVCGLEPLRYVMDPTKNTFAQLYAKICNEQKLQLQNPSVSANGKALFLANKSLRDQFEEDLKKTLKDSFDSGAILEVTDPKVLGRRVAKIKVEFEDGGEVYVPPKE